ncbi:MAG: hypothetical protein RMN25_14440 [Anaerolineae bacterium]|nr:hypothetical protein [Thermoflexales bacterium]MDW8408969.1 hypothetical protein [Anaerolineae bacterium]
MRLIGRVLILLAAALIVVGATVILSNTGALNELTRAQHLERALIGQRSVGPQGFNEGVGEHSDFNQWFKGKRAGWQFSGSSNFERDRFDTPGFNVFGAGEMLRNLMIVAVIVAAVVVLTLAWQWLRRAQQRRKAA